MRALSIRQPFVWAILFAGKRVENRPGWAGCAMRETILLHAGKTCTEKEHAEAVRAMESIGVEGVPQWVAPRHRGRTLGPFEMTSRIAFGALVGTARIAGELRDEMAFDECDALAGARQHRWWGGGFALVLADVHVFERPIPYPAQLNFFDVPAPIYASMRRFPPEDAYLLPEEVLP